MPFGSSHRDSSELVRRFPVWLGDEGKGKEQVVRRVNLLPPRWLPGREGWLDDEQPSGTDSACGACH